MEGSERASSLSVSLHRNLGPWMSPRILTSRPSSAAVFRIWKATASVLGHGRRVTRRAKRPAERVATQMKRRLARRIRRQAGGEGRTGVSRYGSVRTGEARHTFGMSSSNWPGRLCEEFNRNTSTPALISLRIISGVEDVGPSVETTCKAAETVSEVLACHLGAAASAASPWPCEPAGRLRWDRPCVAG